MNRTKRARARLAPLLVALTLPFASCATVEQTYRENPKAVLGSLGGAVLGGGIAAIAGGNPAAIVASTVGGALLGGFVGHKLDDRDKRMAAEAAQRAFEQGRTGQAVAWQNPDSGNSGSITPTQTYQIAGGQYCRRYTQEIMIGGEQHETHGTACRQPDGTWSVQS
jgi:surface antigen